MTSAQTADAQHVLLSVDVVWADAGRRPYFNEKQANPRHSG